MIVYELDELEETEKPRMEYGKNHSDFFSRYEYSDFKSSNRYNNGYFFTNEKDLFMYLIPADNYAIRNLLKEIEKVKVTCLHPLKGKYSETNMVDNSQWREFIPEWP